MKRYFLFLLACWVFTTAQAYETEHLQVSLLTVMPRSDHVYTVYGHTALRLYDPSQQLDEVFNWGTFDFETPNFLYRFVRGETDYLLSTANYARFLFTYQMENSTVVEQILDLSTEGKEILMEKLFINLQPENRIYRYNFLFDNCTTRVRDLIEQSSSGLVYPAQEEETTFRKLIHSCTKPYPWMTFGIDLLVGADADLLLSVRQELFLPVKLEAALDATPVVVSSKQVLTAVPEPDVKHEFWKSPLIVGCFILLIYIVIAITGRWKRRPLKGWFAPLFFIAGAAGCLLAFVAVSYHPCTWPNWNLLWLHPLHLIGFAGCFFKKPRRWVRWYHAANAVILLGVLAGWYWIPQGLNPANVPLVLCLGVGSLSYLGYNKK